jgi:uncharacterized protein (TIGR02646 family)
MRFVDIDLIALPDGWQGRADQALNDLRHEIEQADAAARAAGEDVAGARRKAITQGLNQPAREQIWKDLAPSLAELRRGKCWYSESLNPMADKNVDHFRPKSRVAEDATHEGYWWLAFRWQNFRLASQWCNQRRNDKINKTSGGKADHFPLRPQSFRARQEADDYEREDIELLDPVDPEDWKLLTFRPDGRPTPAKPQGTPEFERAKTSIDVYHLHCKELVDDRRPLAGRIQRLIQNMETLRPQITNPKTRALYMDQEKELLRAIRPEAEYSAAAFAYARAEVYKMERGHQVKRQWLEDILNSHP